LPNTALKPITSLLISHSLFGEAFVSTSLSSGQVPSSQTFSDLLSPPIRLRTHKHLPGERNALTSVAIRLISVL
jgi:hypothetical protein